MRKIKTFSKPVIISLCAIVFVSVAAYHVSPGFAQSLQEIQSRIDSLHDDISESEARLEELREREDTLENRLEILDTEIEQAEAELAQTEEEMATVREEIREIEKELDRKRELIQANAKVLYKNGNPGTLEVMFSSDNFTDFINRQEYLERTKDSLNEAAKEVVALQESLEAEEAELEELHAEQERQRNDIATRIQRQEELLEETRGEEERYQELMAEQQEKLEEMQQKQRAAYDKLAAQARDSGQFVTTDGNGNYPWDGQGLTLGCHDPADCIDPWRLYVGQCVSYVAWKLDSEGYRVYSFDGQGNAADWPDTTTDYWASQYGSQSAATVRSNPKVGYAAVDPNVAAPYGHVMYVEDVHSDGTITVSEYNVMPDRYTERRIGTSGLTFLEFARK